MPKRNVERSISEQGERNLARRIERERTGRGWSYEHLARAMTEAGCPITKAALYNIEQGEPPRRITVDELMALAAVFTHGDVADLLLPIEALDKRVAHELIGRFDRNGDEAAGVAAETFNLAVELRLLALHNKELLEYVMNQAVALAERRLQSEWSGRFAERLDARLAEESDIEKVWEINHDCWSRIFQLGMSRADAIFDEGAK